MTTVFSPLQRAALLAGDEEAVVCGDQRFCYTDLHRRCLRLTGALRMLGSHRGDRVAVIGSNCHRYLELYLSVPAAGMVLVPLSSRMADKELRHALSDSGARVLFTDRPDLSAAADHVIPLHKTYESLLAESRAPETAPDLPGDTLAGLFYTSGTTGGAKGVMLTHQNLLANAQTWPTCIPLGGLTRWALIAPMFHLAGTNAVLATLSALGCHIVAARFDPHQVLNLIDHERVTGTLVVPTMLAAMADEQLAQPRSELALTHLCHGGSPVASETLRRAHRAFPAAELVNIYGTTETSPNITFLTHEESLFDTPQIRSCGQPAAGAEVSIADRTGGSVPTGTTGEVLVRGSGVMAGYWRQPEATEAALQGGWYHTGDLGYLDCYGHLYLVDRMKDLIITGGENVYSTEVEEILYLHPAILEAAVFGIPDPHWGEAVHAIVVLRAPAAIEELQEHCRQHVARFKVPKRIEIVPGPLPKSASGKILKRNLRAPYWADRHEHVAGA